MTGAAERERAALEDPSAGREVIGKAVDDDLARSDAGRGKRLGRAPGIAAGELRFVNSPGRSEETRERARRRGRERAERRLGGLQRRDRRLAHDRNERQIAGPAQFAEIEVAELARERMASPMQFAEPGAQRLEAGFVGHRFPTRCFRPASACGACRS